MSSILNALKKIENDASRRVRNPVHMPKGNKRRRNWLLLVALLLSALVAALVLGRNMPGLERFFPRVGPTQVIGEEEASAPRKPKVAQVPVTPPLGVQPRTLEAIIPPAAEGRNLSQMTRPSPPRAPTGMKPFLPPSVEGEAPGDLQLQAIAWSLDPDGRLAVINGQIVREGGTIKGFSIKEIGAGEVTIEQGKKRMVLKYSRK